MNLEQVVKSIISDIMEKRWKPYGRDDSGTSEDLYWNGEKVASAGSETCCVDASFEVLIKVLKHYKKEDVMTAAQIKKIKSYVYIYDKDTQYMGIAGALVDAGIADFVQDLSKIQCGDFAQYWHVNSENQLRQGHSMVVTDALSTRKEKPVILNWSANTDGNKPGYMYDWHNVEYELEGGYKRTWYIARLKPDWLSA